MGPVGSGKSEQTHRLSERMGINTISTSSLLRDNLTPEREAKMQAGDLVDDQEIIELLQPKIKEKMAAKADFILDGFPRSIPQAQWLVKQISMDRISLTAIIKLNVRDQVVMSRMLARGRSDDQKDIIEHRLETYHQYTDPVVNFLNNNGVEVYEIDGEQTPREIEAQIKDIIDAAKNH